MARRLPKMTLATQLVIIAIVGVSILIGISFHTQLANSISFFWIPLLGLTMLLFCLLGARRFVALENSDASLSTARWLLRIAKMQTGFLLILFGLIVISIPGFVALDTHATLSKVGQLEDVITSKVVLWTFYPYALTAFFATLFGVIASSSTPKMSGAYEALFNKKLAILPAVTADFATLMGFLVGILAMAGILAFFISQFIGNFFHINTHYTLTLRTAAIGFCLIYLPYMPIWGDLTEMLGKARSLSLFSLFLILAIGLALYLVLINVLVDFLFAMINIDINKTLKVNLSWDIITNNELDLLIFAVSIFAAPLLGIYVALISAGRTVRAMLLSLLPLPALMAALGVFFQIYTISLGNTLAPLFSEPAFSIIAFATCLLALSLCRDKSLWLKGLLLLLPGNLRLKKKRIRRFIKRGASFMLYVMLIWLFLGMFGLHKIIITTIIISMGLLIVTTCGFLKYLLSITFKKNEITAYV